MRTDYGRGSVRSQILGLTLRHTARRVIGAWSLAPHLPWPYHLVDQAGRLQAKVAGTRIEQLRIGACRAKYVRTPVSSAERHILYFHGGAFLVGGWHLHDSLMSRIAEETRSTLLAVEYRQLPLHAVHVSTADGVAAYRHLLSLGIAPADIVFMGDSAGGFLAFTVADAAREEGLPVPGSIVAMSPLVDMDLERTPIGCTRRGCHVFPPRAFRAFTTMALRSGGGQVHTPVDCLLPALPPVLLQVSSAESLYPQVCALAEALEAAGVPVHLQVWPGQVHVFQAATLIPESREAIQAIGRYLEAAPAARVRVTA